MALLGTNDWDTTPVPVSYSEQASRAESIPLLLDGSLEANHLNSAAGAPHPMLIPYAMVAVGGAAGVTEMVRIREVQSERPPSVSRRAQGKFAHDYVARR